MNLKALHEPFAADDVEWRLQTCGEKNGRFWAMALCYITNRAIMDRLDEVCGPENWKNEYAPGPGGGIVCGLSIRVGDEWVTKWDGAENTDVEAIKGGLSGAMKRAAVQWGIGRYLYHLKEGWATTDPDKGKLSHRGKTKQGKEFSWDPPALPAWALPGGYGRPHGDPVTLGDAVEPEGDASDELVEEVRLLWLDAARHGLDASETAAMDMIEDAMKAKDETKLTKAKAWLTKKINEAKEAQA